MPEIELYQYWVRGLLRRSKIRVLRWMPWDPNNDVWGDANYDSRCVRIPRPECAHSFLVCLHEIGHIIKGTREHSYLAEYWAEIWALKTASTQFNVQSLAYELECRQYVLMHVVHDVLHGDLKVHKVKPYVLDWLHIDQEDLQEYVQYIEDRERISSAIQA